MVVKRQMAILTHHNQSSLVSVNLLGFLLTSKSTLSPSGIFGGTRFGSMKGLKNITMGFQNHVLWFLIFKNITNQLTLGIWVSTLLKNQTCKQSEVGFLKDFLLLFALPFICTICHYIGKLGYNQNCSNFFLSVMNVIIK